MKYTLYPTILFLFCCANPAFGQTNFRTGWEASNPIDKYAPVPLEEKVKAHQFFLEKASRSGNQLEQLYGQLYLAYDYLFDQDYAQATEYLLKAEAVAIQSDNPGWHGWVMHRKAIVSSRLKQTENALQEYKESARLCGEAKDSLCVAESLEQVSVMYGKLDDFENAQHYHDLAMPLIEKYGGDAQLGASLNNYGTIHNWSGRAAGAVPYFERAIAIYQKLGRPLETAKAMNNLADALRYVHRYDEAEKMLGECIRINRGNNFLESLRTNYANMSALYDSMGDYRGAFKYLDKYYYLNDSLIGAETQRKIAELEIKYATQQKELELEKSKSALEAAERSVERRTVAILFGLLLTSIGLWRWRLQTQQAKREMERNRESLANLTRILVEKNKQLATLSKKTVEEATEREEPDLSDNFDTNLFEQTILTDSDWASFKAHFEKAYPGYLHRLRKAYHALTDAEERLFLFIKLNLNTKEAATILGISPDSVKKTRNRLRKKLELDEKINLEAFVQSF